MFSAGQVTASDAARKFLEAVNGYCAGDANQSHQSEEVCAAWCPTQTNNACVTPSPRPAVEACTAYPQGFISLFGDANHLGSLGYQSSEACGVIDGLKVSPPSIPQPGAAVQAVEPAPHEPTPEEIAAQARALIDAAQQGQTEEGTTPPPPTVVPGQETGQQTTQVQGQGTGQQPVQGQQGTEQQAPAEGEGTSFDLSGFHVGVGVNLDLISVFGTKTVEGGNWSSEWAGDDPDINAGNTELSFYGQLMVDLGYAFSIDSRGDVLYVGGYLGVGWGRTVQPVNIEGTKELLPPDLIDIPFGAKVGPNFVLSAERGVALMPYVILGGMYRFTSGGDPNSGISFPTERDGVPVQDFHYTALQLGLGAQCAVRIRDWVALSFNIDYRRDITSVGYYETHTQDGEAVRNVFFSPDYFDLGAGAIFTF